ncbi:MAG: RsbRD N-terminal domain-containing protein [Chloroflexi bacterium]|nr:RsbRD N-terminal domain-containing protein [Chloroflexota bacterium]
MTLKELLVRNKSKILHRWLDLVLDTYPPETARFLKDEKDRFANPVAFTVKCNLELLLDDLMNNPCEKTVMPHLEEIIKIRAVQDFTPFQAVSFVVLLKEAIANELKVQIKTKEIYAELLKLESEIDKLSGISFNVYSACKDSIYQIRIKELKAENHALSKMLGV